MTILESLTKLFPIRKSAQQKEAFRAHVLQTAREMGYEARVEQSGGKHDNIVIGDPETARVTFTAHYDTPASIGLPNIMIPRNLPFFIGWQILLVGLLLAVSAAVGMAAHFAWPEFENPFIIGWLFYMGVLMLMLYGPANRHNVNDNTSGVAAVLETMALIPPEQRHLAAFILFDNEEKGLRGSKAYAREHMEVQYTHLVVNLDCVGVGENILLITPKLAANMPDYVLLEESIRAQEGRRALFFPKAGSACNSDQKSFKCGVAVMACKRRPVVGYYCSKIHTSRDTFADQGNIDFLAKGLSAFVQRMSETQDPV